MKREQSTDSSLHGIAFNRKEFCHHQGLFLYTNRETNRAVKRSHTCSLTSKQQINLSHNTKMTSLCRFKGGIERKRMFLYLIPCNCCDALFYALHASCHDILQKTPDCCHCNHHHNHHHCHYAVDVFRARNSTLHPKEVRDLCFRFRFRKEASHELCCSSFISWLSLLLLYFREHVLLSVKKVVSVCQFILFYCLFRGFTFLF